MDSNSRFWKKVDKSGDCWIWTASKTKQGYGWFRSDDKVWQAHRWIFIQVNNWEPEVVMHICDNPSCVRLDHLKGGTRAQNQEDMRIKGRHVKQSYSSLCPHGHDEWGYTKTTSKKGLTYRTRYCRICSRERTKQWRNRNVNNQLSS